MYEFKSLRLLNDIRDFFLQIINQYDFYNFYKEFLCIIDITIVT